MPGQSDTFQQGQTATSGPFDGAYLWSNEHNWSTGTIAADGDSIINSASGFNYDDIADLTLASLTQTGDGATYVVAGSLDIDTVSNMGFLGADAFLAGAPVVLTIGAITSSGGDYQAVGAGAELIDNSAADLGNFFGANSGGLIELAGAPASNTTLDYVGSPPGTIALENPGATILGTLENVGVGDVLELPGTSVSSVSFGTDTLSVTTNVGTYTFDHVSYEAGIDSYGASHDAASKPSHLPSPIRSSRARRQPAASSMAPICGATPPTGSPMRSLSLATASAMRPRASTTTTLPA
jgi:hypothetical protein